MVVRYKCVSCENIIHGNRSDPICYSSLYGAAEIVLCKSCSDAEEKAILKAGTNDIPDLLKKYATPNYFM